MYNSEVPDNQHYWTTHALF